MSDIDRAERAEELAVEIQNLMRTEQEDPYDRFSDLLDNAQAELMTCCRTRAYTRHRHR